MPERREEALQIEGMHCGHCVRAVRQALEELEGVEVRDVQIGTARISYDAGVVDHQRILEAIEDQGYSVQEIREAPATGS